MIKFFRRIREKQLLEGRVSKYLLYAIGEIVLVVIGILLALQINNWNDLNKERQKERIYLESLESEFRTNLETLNQVIASCNKLDVQLGEILTFFDTQKSDTATPEFIALSLGKCLSYEVVYTPTTGVQKDLISSGNLKQIGNAHLRQQIASFETSLETIKKQESKSLDLKKDITKSINGIISMRSIFKLVGNPIPGNSKFEQLDIKPVFDNMALENNFILYQAITRTTGNVYYQSLKKDIETIMELITKELNSKGA
ncbi:MAG: DUF6090 family protein [Bacteroidota bacterium]